MRLAVAVGVDCQEVKSYRVRFLRTLIDAVGVHCSHEITFQEHVTFD